MGLDFDINDYVKSLKNSDPPYKCAVKGCDKTYRSLFGLNYHLTTFDHDNPEQNTPVRKNRKSRGGHGTPKAALNDSAQQKEPVTYDEVLKIVHYNAEGGKTVKVTEDELVPVVSLEEFNAMLEDGAIEIKPLEPMPEPEVKLPEAKFKLVENYNIADAPPRGNAYIRYIEKSAEELDAEVEYDVDEEDTTWLQIMNEKRKEQGLNMVSVDAMELLMDRLEKESYFQAAANGQTGAVVDDDAVCCICMDGECQNTNVILFCDMCNLAVHQDCYGVPYIPEGQWLCRRCLQSPSRPVDCVLCPNAGTGAFKQTDRGTWAHVVCALWIPEVRFANTVFLEPIDSIEMIPPARWKLVCYICKQKGVGACIQCNKNSCYMAFHVTCAQQAGLCMKMEQVKGNHAHPIIVQKTAFCDSHTPADASGMGMSEEQREESRKKMKKARQMLEKKRTSAPVIHIPTIPPDKVQEISGMVNFQKKAQFMQRLIAYWTLKRQYRNGVPLLRRLQTQQNSHNRTQSALDGSPDAKELYHQLKYWQCLRQDLERARLLCELVRKREKVKLALVKTTEQCVMLEINPLEVAFTRILDQLEAKDNGEIFAEPVDTNEVPDYMDVVSHPMDLSTMRHKVQTGEYFSLESLESDFDLMIRNCLAYNNKDTIFYRAGIRMKDAGATIFRAARRELERSGLIESGKSEDALAASIDNELKEITQKGGASGSASASGASTEKLSKLQKLLERAQALKTPAARNKRVKNIRTEITKMRKNLNASAVTEPLTLNTTLNTETPSNSPMKNNHNSAASSVSPSGVNRRTAVLFTRKAHAAALKKPDLLGGSGGSGGGTGTGGSGNGHHNSSSSNKRSLGVDRNDVTQALLENPKSPLKGRGRQKKGRKSSEPDYQLPVGSPKNLNKSFDAFPDSFRVYRGQQDRVLSDSDESDMSFTGSSCSSCSSDSFSSSCDDSDQSDMISSDDADVNTCSSNNHDDGSPPPRQQQQQQQQKSRSQPKPPALGPLKLVWAKCRGYPWYPALIIDPKIGRDFLHNGVPLPVPPQDVLNLRKNYQEPVFLVLFFDVKRTWQWLPPMKLELLGIDRELDQSKLTESRKPQERKAVKKAYQEALHYQNQVTSSGPPIGKL